MCMSRVSVCQIGVRLPGGASTVLSWLNTKTPFSSHYASSPLLHALFFPSPYFRYKSDFLSEALITLFPIPNVSKNVPVWQQIWCMCVWGDSSDLQISFPFHNPPHTHILIFLISIFSYLQAYLHSPKCLHKHSTSVWRMSELAHCYLVAWVSNFFSNKYCQDYQNTDRSTIRVKFPLVLTVLMFCLWPKYFFHVEMCLKSCRETTDVSCPDVSRSQSSLSPEQ